jgi:hypothetical protein
MDCRKFFELRLTDDGLDFETTSMMEYAPYLVNTKSTWDPCYDYT